MGREVGVGRRCVLDLDFSILAGLASWDDLGSLDPHNGAVVAGLQTAHGVEEGGKKSEMIVLGSVGWLWVVVGCCGLLWVVVDGCGWLWMVVDGFGLLWMVVDELMVVGLR